MHIYYTLIIFHTLKLRKLTCGEKKTIQLRLEIGIRNINTLLEPQDHKTNYV
jgi:hypothetical protein